MRPVTLPLDSYDEVRELAAELLGPRYVPLTVGWEDDAKYVVPYEERDGPSWDLPTLVIEKATGQATMLPWMQGYGITEGMRRVIAKS